MSRLYGRFFALATALVACLLLTPASAQIVAGENMSGGTGAEIPVPYSPTSTGWIIEADLLFDPSAPPMTKVFDTPRDPTGEPIPLDALQPFPLVIDEYYNILGGLPGTPPGRSVLDWHEIILTPGWQWVIPGDPAFPGLFPPGTSLITRNGQPWPWDFLPGTTPSDLNIIFPPIEPGDVLDIHKALLWVGTDTQRIWGDDPTETSIIVVEYPTPEPSTFVLGGVGLAALALAYRRRRRR